MRRGLKRAIVGTALAAITTAAIPATAAFAINVATPCPRSDYVDVITSLNFHHCYANAGTLNVTINDAKVFRSGNNTVTFHYTDNTHLDLARNVSWTMPSSKTVNWIKIY